MQTIQKKSVNWLFDLYNNGELDLNPPFMRPMQTLTNNMKYQYLQELISCRTQISLISNIINNKTVYQVLEGRERLLTVFDFVKGVSEVDKKKEENMISEITREQILLSQVTIILIRGKGDGYVSILKRT